MNVKIFFIWIFSDAAKFMTNVMIKSANFAGLKL